MHLNWRKWLLGSLIFLLFLGTFLNSFWVDWIWFRAEGFAGVWLKIITTNIILNLVVFIVLWLILALNVFKARQNILLSIVQDYQHEQGMSLKNYLLNKILNGTGAKIILLAFTGVLALTVAASSDFDWQLWQKFINKIDFAVTDPIFNKDVGFYVFRLPLLLKSLNTLLNALFAALFLSVALYTLTMPGLIINFRKFSKAHSHLTMLGAALLFLQAAHFYLERYLLLYSPKGAAYGASFTDVHASLPGLNILTVITIAAAIVLIYCLWLKNFKFAFGSILCIVLASLGLQIAYPLLVQKLQVEPNEFNKEQLYLKNNISYTLKAYGLDKVKTENFPVNNTLTAGDLALHSKTISNVRLWDWRPIEQTYNQLQSLRPYYVFPEVDVDRYQLDGTTRQVLIAARELDSSRLDQAQTWVNKHLRYTHGYGAVVSPASEVTPEGLPTFYLKDIPLAAEKPFAVERPELYFGEKTTDYVLVKTKTKEFDYPLGENNAENYYAGSGGVRIKSLLHRLNFALYFKDYKLLLTRDLTTESRLLFHRQISARAEKIAPFLRYDPDPYLVISGKKLYWIQDAYTTTNMYPYAKPTAGWGNYIRNAVKVVTDAYNGRVTFYLADETDPIIQAYHKIFPGLFKPLSQMPPDLKSHLRYPETLFKIQSSVYTTYHMENPMVFYNKEDAWSIPDEIVAGETRPMDPYYMVMQLPGESQEEFILMLPFTAAKINKMVAWLAARNDAEHYGELVVYKFPKEKHIYGPLQIEARIDQDSEISQQLTLWDQRGSQVLRGNLLVIPMENSILYIEPLYLQAEKSKIPELRRVIAIYGERVVMSSKIEDALKELFANAPITQKTDAAAQTVPELIADANKYYQEAIEKQKAGDWAGYGIALQHLQETLIKLQELSQAKQ
ncbi:UPF0182 family protein [Zhaonella formicivorans]|uniref:UPF0182 family membrane protein n=1 Tax=Zhaonella formicivorans TaxID=2528593 RepID=UPI0010D1609A|nr:UPF0182 family protein [Zhaonella formicivorans]